LEAIEERLRKRAAWIIRQQRYFAQFQPRTPERRYVAGETHLYLGRQYRLKIVPDEREMVKLVRGFIFVHATSRANGSGRVRELLEDWYRSRARVKFPERIKACLKAFPTPEEFRPKGLIIRKFRRRWGSMSPSGRLLLNLRLIQAPIDAVDYVITHELCHIAEPHHGPAFLDLLSRVMPDWERRKSRLERVLA
jgi:predicted metal-dependent hydrolase